MTTVQPAATGLPTRPEVADVRDLRPGEVPAAVALLARGMRDNPLHVAAYGDDPDRRERCHAALMAGLFRVFGAQEPLAAVAADGTLLGVTGVAPAGTCQPTPAQRLRLLPTMAGLGPRTAARVGAWLGAWASHDPDEAHVHLGPLGVDLPLQGQGIGSAILAEHCRRLDAAGAVGYLETDKAINVRLYERYGYVVVAQADVIGVPGWFMRRPAA
jgi:ribosomal protein S18 acetylase RimI-like enzyme